MRRVVAIATAAGATLALLSCQVLFPDVIVNGDGGPADGETVIPDVAPDRAPTDAGSSDATRMGKTSVVTISSFISNRHLRIGSRLEDNR